MKNIKDQIAESEARVHELAAQAATETRRLADLRALEYADEKFGKVCRQMPITDLRALVQVASAILRARQAPKDVVALTHEQRKDVLKAPTVRLSADEVEGLRAQVGKSKVHG